MRKASWCISQRSSSNLEAGRKPRSYIIEAKEEDNLKMQEVVTVTSTTNIYCAVVTCQTFNALRMSSHLIVKKALR